MLGRKYYYAISVYENENSMTIKFRLSLWMRISSKSLSKELKELRDTFWNAGFEVDIRKIYDKLVEVCDEKLPGLQIY